MSDYDNTYSFLAYLEIIDVDQLVESNGSIVPNADHSVIKQLNDSAFSISGNQGEHLFHWPY